MNEATDSMEFPKTWGEFADYYGYVDMSRVFFVDAIEVIPRFRVEQWLKHIEPVRPLPCVRDEDGDMFCRPVKEFVLKIYEELSEVQEAVHEYGYNLYTGTNLPKELEGQPRAKYLKMRIAEEAADTITAITTLLEALGIDANMRDEAQRRVNSRNMERGRL